MTCAEDGLNAMLAKVKPDWYAEVQLMMLKTNTKTTLLAVGFAAKPNDTPVYKWITLDLKFAEALETDLRRLMCFYRSCAEIAPKSTPIASNDVRPQTSRKVDTGCKASVQMQAEVRGGVKGWLCIDGVHNHSGHSISSAGKGFFLSNDEVDEVLNLTTKDLIELSAICRMLGRTTGIQPDRSQLERIIRKANQLKGNEFEQSV
jgi:hypothetical protein